MLRVITRLDDKATVLRDEAADGGDDAGAIGTGDGQGVTVGSGHVVCVLQCVE